MAQRPQLLSTHRGWASSGHVRPPLGALDERTYEGCPVVTRPYCGDGSLGPFTKFLHEYSEWSPRLRSNYGHLRSPIAKSDSGVCYFVETLDRARFTDECVPFQRNTAEELTYSLGTHLSWVPTVNTDHLPQFDSETNIGPFRIYARLVHYDLMWLRLGHNDGNKGAMVWFDWHIPRRGRGGGDPDDRFPPSSGPGRDEDSPYMRLDLDVHGGATFHHGPRPHYPGRGAVVYCDDFVSTNLSKFVDTDISSDSTAPGDTPPLGLGDDLSGDSSDASTVSAGPPPLVPAPSSSSSSSGDESDLWSSNSPDGPGHNGTLFGHRLLPAQVSVPTPAAPATFTPNPTHTDPHTAAVVGAEVVSLARAGVFDTNRERPGWTAEAERRALWQSRHQTHGYGRAAAALAVSQAGDHYVFLNVGGTTMAARGSAIDPTHELLDSQSTINIFSNKKLLRHIQRVLHYIMVYFNAGCSRTNLFGFRDGHGWVWYDPHGIGNIYSMKLMTKRYRVTFNSNGTGADRNTFVVHRPNGPMCFVTDDTGLYFRAVHGGPEALARSSGELMKSQ